MIQFCHVVLILFFLTSGCLCQFRLSARSDHFIPQRACVRQQVKNPYAGQAQAVRLARMSMRTTAALATETLARAQAMCRRWPMEPHKQRPDGAIFWYITQGDVNNGMPSWAGLPADNSAGKLSPISSR